MFDTLAKGLNEGGGSVRAYEDCARNARARIASEPENAAALLLIAYAAQRFVDAYDDQPLTLGVAAAEFEQFDGIVQTLDKAFTDGSAEDRLRALNTVAARMSESARS